MPINTKEEALLNYLSEFVLPSRIATFRKNADKRTRYLTVVLEDIFQSHNASAVLRTCDCFGVHDVHVVENRNELTVNPEIAMGSSKWLSLLRFNEAKENSPLAVSHLRKKGYRIVATSPHVDGTNLEDFDLSKGRAALFMGTERIGLSDYIMEEADEHLKIPMYGFTESFNISVSAAIILHHLSLKLRSSEIKWQLQHHEKVEILLKWVRNNIKKVELIEQKFFETHPQPFVP
ncbi:MAG: RNA methyltransferase [Bacteroidales bacterium]|nr:RNA methyltransferase [Bacteroidales bacterium]MCF8455101.1 RNA methyltransferase [Bacteroidales bacterium]